MTKIQNSKPVYDLEERTIQFLKYVLDSEYLPCGIMANRKEIIKSRLANISEIIVKDIIFHRVKI